MSSRPRFALSFLGFLLVWGVSAGADDKASPEPGWIKDTKGCKIANPTPSLTRLWHGPDPAQTGSPRALGYCSSQWMAKQAPVMRATSSKG